MVNLFLGSSFARVWMRALLALQSEPQGARLPQFQPQQCSLPAEGPWLLSRSVPSASHLSDGLLVGPPRGLWVSRNPWEADCSVPGQGSSANTGNADTPETNVSLCRHHLGGSSCFIPGFLGRGQALNAKGSSPPSKDLCYLALPHPGPLPASLTPWYSWNFLSTLSFTGREDRAIFEVRETKCHNPYLQSVRRPG